MRLLLLSALGSLVASVSASQLCTSNACSIEMRALPTHSAFCHAVFTKFPAPKDIPSCIVSKCGKDPLRIASACACVMLPTPTTTTHHSTTTTSKKSSSSWTTTKTSSTSCKASTLQTTSPKSASLTTTTARGSVSQSSSPKSSGVSSSTPHSTSSTAPIVTSTSSTTSSSITATAITSQAPQATFDQVCDFQDGSLENFVAVGNAQVVQGRAYVNGVATTGYAVQMVASATNSVGRKMRRQTTVSSAGITQALTLLSTASQYTASLGYYLDFTSSYNSNPVGCSLIAEFAGTQFGSVAFPANTGQASAWATFTSSFSPKTAGGTLEFLLACTGSGAALVLLDDIRVTNTSGTIVNTVLTSEPTLVASGITSSIASSGSSVFSSSRLVTTTTSTTSANTVAAATTTNSVPAAETCSVHLNLVPPSFAICQKEIVSVNNGGQIASYTGLNFVECAALCLANAACTSFSSLVGAAGSTAVVPGSVCNLWPNAVSTYGYTSGTTSSLYVWDVACWYYNGNCVNPHTTSTTSMTSTTSTAAATCQPNLVVNGGFEAPSTSASTLIGAPWTFDDQNHVRVCPDCQVSTLTYGAEEGSYFVVMLGDYPGLNNFDIHQTISGLSTTQTYNLNYYYAAQEDTIVANGVPNCTLTSSFAGTPINSYTWTSDWLPGWTLSHNPFLPSASSGVLKFSWACQGMYEGADLFIDNITLSVAEPLPVCVTTYAATSTATTTSTTQQTSTASPSAGCPSGFTSGAISVGGSSFTLSCLTTISSGTLIGTTPESSLTACVNWCNSWGSYCAALSWDPTQQQSCSIYTSYTSTTSSNSAAFVARIISAASTTSTTSTTSITSTTSAASCNPSAAPTQLVLNPWFDELDTGSPIASDWGYSSDSMITFPTDAGLGHNYLDISLDQGGVFDFSQSLSLSPAINYRLVYYYRNEVDGDGPQDCVLTVTYGYSTIYTWTLSQDTFATAWTGAVAFFVPDQTYPQGALLDFDWNCPQSGTDLMVTNITVYNFDCA